MRDLPFEEYTQSEVDEAVKAFKEGKPKKRIIIDLKDKVTKSAISDEISLDLNNTIQNEALSALVALGFSKKIAQQKIDKALTNKQGNFDVETLIRESLSQM